MFQLKFWQKDNTFYSTNFARQWANSTVAQREAKRAEARDRGGSIYRILWTLWLPNSIRIQIVRLK
jgi:hypothetical protein